MNEDKSFLKSNISKEESVKPFATFVKNGFYAVTTDVFAALIFLEGATLALTGTRPSVDSFFYWLTVFLPLSSVETSLFLGSLLGTCLVILAWSIKQKTDGAYFITLTLFALGIFFSLLKGFDYKEAIILSLLFIALLPQRKSFYRQAAFVGERFTLRWILAVLAIVGSIAISLVFYQQMANNDCPWWKFVLQKDLSPPLRIGAGILSIIVFFAAWRLLRPARLAFARSTPEELEKACRVVNTSKSTAAYLALLGDKRFIFSETGNSFLMYNIYGDSWIALNASVGPEMERKNLVWRFHAMCDRYGGRPVFWDIGQRDFSLYLDLGLSFFKIGEEALVPLADFSLETIGNKNFRHIYHKAENEGCAFAIVSREEVPVILPRLASISEDWLHRKNTKEKGFCLGFYNEDYLKRLPVAIVKRGGEIVAFANLWMGAEKEELSVDLMRFTSNAPQSLIEYLFLSLMLWGKEQGYKYFNLGLSPLSGIQTQDSASMWNKIGSALFNYGEKIYNFHGLRIYKEKYKPIWEPKYLACKGGFSSFGSSIDLATLISGGLKGIFSK